MYYLFLFLPEIVNLRAESFCPLCYLLAQSLEQCWTHSRSPHIRQANWKIWSIKFDWSEFSDSSRGGVGTRRIDSFLEKFCFKRSRDVEQ